MNESLVRHNSKFNFSPFFFLQFRAPPSLSLPFSFPPLKHPLQASYPRLILVVKLLLPWLIPLWMTPPLTSSPLSSTTSPWWKSPLKDLMEAQRSSLHRSPTSMLPSRGPLMVIFHHGDAAEDKGEEERGGTIH